MTIYRLRDIIILNSKYEINEEIKYLELSGIANFETTLKSKSHIPSRAKWSITSGTILIGRVRPLNKNHNIYKQEDNLVASSGFTCFKANNEIVQNDFLWYNLQSSRFYNYTVANSRGSTYPEISQSDLLDFEIIIPSIPQQQKIIDIIAPIEQCIHNVQKQIKVLKKILVNQYKLNNEELVSFVDYITLCSFKFNDQKGYLATNAISEFSIDYSKLQIIEVTNRPSRANLTPEVNSLIISKLDGENKAYYIDESFPYVVSTGFFNFTTKYLDHITGFILSDSFKEQKSIFSTGTTMIGLNNDSLFKIKMVKPSISSNTCTLKLNSLLKVEQELYSTLNILIKLLIK